MKTRQTTSEPLPARAGSGAERPNFIEIWNRFQMEQRAEKALKDATTDEIETVWREWDGMNVMKLGGVYIPDSWIVAELHKRGIDPGI